MLNPEARAKTSGKLLHALEKAAPLVRDGYWAIDL